MSMSESVVKATSAVTYTRQVVSADAVKNTMDNKESEITKLKEQLKVASEAAKAASIAQIKAINDKAAADVSAILAAAISEDAVMKKKIVDAKSQNANAEKALLDNISIVQSKIFDTLSNLSAAAAGAVEIEETYSKAVQDTEEVKKNTADKVKAAALAKVAAAAAAAQAKDAADKAAADKVAAAAAVKAAAAAAAAQAKDAADKAAASYKDAAD